MKNLSRVVWSEGMHLSVHHFQAQNKYFEDSIHFAASALWFATYGLVECKLDDEAIQNGKVKVTDARGVLPDGLTFSMSEADPLVDDLDIRPLMSEIDHSAIVYLGAPRYRPEGPNCALDETSEAVRYSAQKLTIHDENTGRDEKELHLARKNLRLYVERQAPPEFTGFPIARVLRDAGRFVYDAKFIPPCLHIMGSKALTRMAERLIDRLAEKSAVLSVYSQGRTSGRSGFSQGEVSGFWFLNTVNSSLPTLRHLLRLGRVHPEELFAAMLRLAGSLCTFGLDSKPDSLPLYDHDRLTEQFEELEKHIQTHLEFVIPTNCVTIPLKAYGDYFHAGAVQDERCLGTSRWILSVRAALGEADLISRAPKLIKVCSAMHIKKLVEKALPGLVLTHISSPPTAISPKISNQYFSITKTGPCWDHIASSKQVGVYVPREIPGLQIEILVVL